MENDSDHVSSTSSDDSSDLERTFCKRKLEKEERETLAKKETKAVGYLRVILLVVLLFSAVTVSVSSFVYNRSNEVNSFEAHFSASAKKVINSFHESFERKLAASDALSISMTSYALSTESSFPNVTLPHFVIRGSNSRIMSDSIVTYWLPLVTDETRNGWEAYSSASVGYLKEQEIEESRLTTVQDQQFLGGGHRYMQGINDSFSKQIFHYGDGDNVRGQVVETEGSGPFLPVWQTTPALSTQGAINLNMLANPLFSEDLMAALHSEKATMSRAVEINDLVNNNTNVESSRVDTANPANLQSLYEPFFRAGQYRHSTEQYTAGPTTNLLYPVFDQFGLKKELAGILVTSISWSLYFTDILPANTNGVICVLENSKNQTYTYRIDGMHVTFLGSGDKHDSKYDHLELWVDVKARIEEEMGPENWSYTAAELFADYCRYNLRIYPSKKMEDAFITNQPIINAFVLASIFCFTSLLFIGYDFLVARRQTIVLDRAAVAGAMVSSLYPRNVRERLFADATSSSQAAQGRLSGEGNEISAADKLKRFLIRGGAEGTNDILPVAALPSSSAPIADHFAATTIMFGDLAGFTRWSAGRDPEQVFQLLENLYSAFDGLASRRKVFKVETIGDCYVAVTGLPDPQHDHAVRIARFANNCMVEMKKITTGLKQSLGEETGDLMMRIGLHSGAVTAGVLRGQKSRFQLFGDTMNTASRMESNGEKGRIHVSQATADEIIANGKQNWITPREDKVVAKGKGEMQTFWLDVNNDLRASVTSSDETSRAEFVCHENVLGAIVDLDNRL